MTGRELLAFRVNLDRTTKFKTLDAARIKAEISRGSWEAVEKGKSVRPSTLRAVEKALGWPAGRAERIIGGTDDAGDIYKVIGDFREWVETSDTFSEAQRRELGEWIDQMREKQAAVQEALDELKPQPQEQQPSQHAEGA